MRDLIIGIDAGTSVIKSVAFDLKGRQLAAAALPNSYEAVGRTGAVQDMGRTWADTARTLSELARTVAGLSSRVAAIAVTAQGDGTWLIDRAGEPVGKGWLWLDARAGDIVGRLRDEAGDAERFRHTGSGLAACQQGPQLRWMLENAPEMLDGAATGFHCKDWLYFKLTGKRATDPSEACFSFGDFRDRRYCDAVIGFLGLEKQKGLFPEIVDGAAVHHALCDEAAAVTGLAAGTPVVLGYVDVICTALGAGLYDLETETGCTVIGSTGMHMRLARTPADVRLNEARTGYTMCMPVPGVCAQMQSNLSATLNVDWILSVAAGLLKQMGVERSKADLIDHVESWLAEAKERTPIFHPYISEAGERGPFVDASARASFIGLSASDGFADMVRAVFDGLAFAARDCYLAMGPLPGQVRLTGGAARSASLRRILGAALKAEIQTSAREEAGAAGAAMIAAVSLGLYRSMADCAREWVAPCLRAAEPPDAALSRYFDTAFPAYKASREAMAPVWKMIAGQRDTA